MVGINDFDFDCRKLKPVVSLKETKDDNMTVMMRGLESFCMSCRMCEIGCKLTKEGYDPHVVNNGTYSKFMVIGQNPGRNECELGIPFVGAAGKNFDKELKKNKISRKMFYISNITKCYTDQNRKPTNKEKETCASLFLTNEIKILKPKLLITLGESSFSFFCPNYKYSDRLGKITDSEYGKVYAVYHPSPRNLNDKSRYEKFSKQIRMLSKLIRNINQ